MLSGVEDHSIEEPHAQPAIEAFDVAVLLGRAPLDAVRADPCGGDPFPHDCGHGIKATVGEQAVFLHGRKGRGPEWKGAALGTDKLAADLINSLRGPKGPCECPWAASATIYLSSVTSATACRSRTFCFSSCLSRSG